MRNRPVTMEHEILNELRSLRTMVETRFRAPGKPWTLEEAAAFLSCSEAWIRKWIARGRIQAIKHGWRTKLADETVQGLAREGLPKLPESATIPAVPFKMEA